MMSVHREEEEHPDSSNNGGGGDILEMISKEMSHIW